MARKGDGHSVAKRHVPAVRQDSGQDVSARRFSFVARQPFCRRGCLAYYHDSFIHVVLANYS